MSNLFKEIGRGYTRGFVIWLAAAAIVVPLTCVLICFPLWLVTSRDLPVWILILSSAIFLALMFGAIPVVLVGTYLARKRKLDAVFLPLGMQGKMLHLLFRQYHGTVAGRQLGVYFYRGPILEIAVDTSLQTRLVASQTRPRAAADLLGEKPLPLDDPALAELQVYVADEQWAQRLIRQPEVPQLLLELTKPQDNFVYRHITLRPGKLTLMSAFNPRLFRFELDPQETRGWVHEVISLAEKMEAVEPPAAAAKKTGFEELLDRSRRSNQSQ